jgi:hypothetical protein
MDREQKEYTALREMGINVDDSLRLTKFIQHDTTNSKYKSLAQTIFTTPNMTLSRATFLFETYHPGEQPPPAEPSALSVNAIFCNYCRKHGHKTKACKKKTSDEKKAEDFQRFIRTCFRRVHSQTTEVFVLYLQGQRPQSSRMSSNARGSQMPCRFRLQETCLGPR